MWVERVPVEEFFNICICTFRAKRIRKALGGTGRQIGFMAAAALYSLENMVTRLHEDHDNVQRIANGMISP